MAEIIISPTIETLLSAQSESEAKAAIGIYSTGPVNSIVVSAVIADFMDSATAAEARTAIGAGTGTSGLIIGTTTITSGTTGRILYENAGTLGELATTGSGAVVLASAISGFGSGTVTSVPDTISNGVAIVWANRTTTPTATVTLGDIQPSTVITNSIEADSFNGNTLTTGTGTLMLATFSLTAGSSGTVVTSVSTANGVSATNTAGALSFTLGDIAPSSVSTGDIIAGTLSIGSTGNSGGVYLSNGEDPARFLGILNADAMLTTSRTVSFDVHDANRTISLSGNLTIGSAFTTSGDTLVTNGFTYTLPGANKALLATDGSGASLTGLTAANITASTTVGRNLLNLANPSAVTWNRVNADNTVSSRTASQTLSDIGGDNASNISSGTLAAARGGTGVSNTGTITLAGNLVTTGAFNTTFAQAATTTVTLPSTSSTMARTDAAQTFTGLQTFGGGISIVTSASVPFQIQHTATNGFCTCSLFNSAGSFKAEFGYGNASTVSPYTSRFYISTNTGVDFAFVPAGTLRAMLYSTGGWYIGSAPTDPGVNNLAVQGTLAVTGTSTFTAATQHNGGITNAGAAIWTPQALSGAGAINITTAATDYTSTGAAEALTLANGTVGQIKTITHIVKGTLGTGVLTPTTKSGYTTVTFNNAGDSVTLRYCTTAGWCVIGSFGVVIA